MGILANALSISLGAIIGSRLKKSISPATFDILGIGIMTLSLVGFLEGILEASSGDLKSTGLIAVILSLIAGTLIGNRLQLGQRLTRLCEKKRSDFSAVIEATLLFGVGGLQISGPILLASGGDNSQLYLKALVDLPFALLFGATYGRSVALASFPVALMQLGMFGIALLGAPLLEEALISQITSMGYIILFFTGYNALSVSENKIENVNMLPAIFVNILFYFTVKLSGGAL